MVAFNKRLRDLREKNRYTQLQLSKYLHIGNKTISDYERGVSQPDPETLKRISSFFNVSVDYLLGHSDKERTPTISQYQVSDDDNDFLFALSGEVDDLSPELKETILNYVKFVKEEEKKKEK